MIVLTALTNCQLCSSSLEPDSDTVPVAVPMISGSHMIGRACRWCVWIRELTVCALCLDAAERDLPEPHQCAGPGCACCYPPDFPAVTEEDAGCGEAVTGPVPPGPSQPAVVEVAVADHPKTRRPTVSERKSTDVGLCIRCQNMIHEGEPYTRHAPGGGSSNSGGYTPVSHPGPQCPPPQAPRSRR